MLEPDICSSISSRVETTLITTMSCYGRTAVRVVASQVYIYHIHDIVLQVQVVHLLWGC